MKKIIRAIIKWLSKFAGCETVMCSYRTKVYYDMVVSKKDLDLYSDVELDSMVRAKLYEGLRSALTASAENVEVSCTDTRAGDRIYRIEVSTCNCSGRCDER